MAERHDYAFPFQIDAESRQGRRAAYADHVRQMVVQLLLTTPGERADLPEFGCGLRAMLFAGNSSSVAAATEMLVRQSLERWLAEHLKVKQVDVSSEDATLEVLVVYDLVATRETDRAEVTVR